MSDSALQNNACVLLTGATGLVGSIVLAKLLECHIPVAVLVRSNRRQSAADRIESLLCRLEHRFQHMLGRPVILEGELARPQLGLSSNAVRWIEQNCATVIHSAANLLFSPANRRPDNEPYRTNVEGTRALLDLVTRVGIREFHYVSTAYVAGLRGGIVQENDLNVGQEFGNDYERSKTQAEQMLRESSALDSLTVYRPSIVIDLHPTTAMRSDQTINSAFMMFQSLSQRFGLPDKGEWFQRLGFLGSEQKNIVTVDWVANVVAEIFRRPSLHRRTYHLTNASGTSVLTLEESFHAAMLDSGLKLPPKQSGATSQIDEQAAPFVAAFQPYFRDDPVFDRRHTETAAATCGIKDQSPISVEMLRSFCLRQIRPVGNEATTLPDCNPWQRFVSAQIDVFGSAAETSLSNDASFGLELLGPGGGQWRVIRCGDRWILQAAIAASETIGWISTTTTLNDLIEERCRMQDAVQSGAVSCEFRMAQDDGLLQSDEVKALELLESLIEGIRRSPGLSNVRHSEVTHVR
jgi:thioester reductase-like protein